jgi:hypothetical protein
VHWLWEHEASRVLMEEVEAETAKVWKFIIDREIEAPERFRSIQSYRCGPAHPCNTRLPASLTCCHGVTCCHGGQLWSWAAFPNEVNVVQRTCAKLQFTCTNHQCTRHDAAGRRWRCCGSSWCSWTAWRTPAWSLSRCVVSVCKACVLSCLLAETTAHASTRLSVRCPTHPNAVLQLHAAKSMRTLQQDPHQI